MNIFLSIKLMTKKILRYKLIIFNNFDQYLILVFEFHNMKLILRIKI